MSKFSLSKATSMLSRKLMALVAALGVVLGPASRAFIKRRRAYAHIVAILVVIIVILVILLILTI